MCETILHNNCLTLYNIDNDIYTKRFVTAAEEKHTSNRRLQIFWEKLVDFDNDQLKEYIWCISTYKSCLACHKDNRCQIHTHIHSLPIKRFIDIRNCSIKKIIIDRNWMNSMKRVSVYIYIYSFASFNHTTHLNNAPVNRFDMNFKSV